MNIVLFLALISVLALAAGVYWVLQRRSEKAALFGVIENLTRERPSGVDVLARLTGRALGYSGQKFCRRETFTVFTSDLDSHALLERVRVFVPASVDSKAGLFLELHVKRSLRIKPKNVEKRFGPLGSDGAYQRPWGTVRFVFSWPPEYLERVDIDAGVPSDFWGLWEQSFVPYPGARQLCSQSVDSFQPGGGFSWFAYVTGDLPEKVMDFYLQEEGQEHAERDEDSLTIRREKAILSVHPASAKNYPRCGKEPGPDDHTVIIVSSVPAPRKEQ